MSAKSTEELAVALFSDRARADRGILALRAVGFSREQISVHEGGRLVTVSAGPRAEEARGLLAAAGADLGPAKQPDQAPLPPYDRRQPERSGRRRTDIGPSASAV